MLSRILETADLRAEVAAGHIDDFMRTAVEAPPPRSLAAALLRPGLSVVAEIKRRSPSAGDIDADLDPVAQARAYEDGGADAISVLTEPYFFGGTLDDLARVRTAVSVPVLRKDFTRNAAQIWEARAAGADAVLLIVAALTQERLEELVAVSHEIGVDAIVETHTTEEVARAAAAGATVIGVNNRDLATFETDLSVAEGVAAHLPEASIAIAESGVSSVDGAARMARAGYQAILVGEVLVRHRDPASFVAALKGAS